MTMAGGVAPQNLSERKTAGARVLDGGRHTTPAVRRPRDREDSKTARFYAGRVTGTLRILGGLRRDSRQGKTHREDPNAVVYFDSL